jgi:autotransporter translocation and assembly factor TamB
VVRGVGRVDWPRDTLLYDFELTGPEVALADLRWISPGFPALTGRGAVRARSIAGSRSEFDLTGLDLGDGRARVEGGLVAILDVYRGLGFRNLDLRLTDFDLEAVRPYLDTLPLAGRLTGPLRASGFFDAMTVRFDWEFRDAGVADTNRSRVVLDGRLALGSERGITFLDARLERSDLDLRTVRLLAPAVLLEGRLALAGSLEGPWRNVVFDGEAVHADAARPASRVRGRARLDTRGAVLAVEADLALDSLAFDGLRGSFPALPMRGGLRGRVRLAGDLEDLDVRADVAGAVGRLVARGRATLQPPRWAARDLVVDFVNADLASLRGAGPPTRLTGRLDLTGRVDTLVAPEAALRLAVGGGRVREAPLDSARVVLAIRDSVLVLDTARAWWEGGEATAAGALGWFEPHGGTIEGEALALALGAFDSLAVALAGAGREALAEGEHLAGRARGRFTLSGSLDRWRLEATARADSVRWLDYDTRSGTLRLDWEGGRRADPRFALRAMVDSASVGRYQVQGIEVVADGAPDRFAWRVGAATPRFARGRAAGSWVAADSGRAVGVDSAAVTLLGRTWRLGAPALVRVGPERTVVDGVVLAPDDGSGRVQLSGALPGREPARLDVSVLGLRLRDLYALLQRDTTAVAGLVALDGRMEGTARSPRLRGSGSVTGAVLGDFRAPLVRGVFNYEDRRLESNLTFWRTGRTVLDVDASLPLDLGLTGVDRRQVPGSLRIRGQADSVDLAVVEAFTRNLQSVRGWMAVDARVEGTWDTPRLGGAVTFRDGAARVPGLNVRYTGIEGRIRLAGDSLVADGLRVRSGDGRLEVGGGVRLERLTRPLLDLTLTAYDFPVIDVRDYLTLRARGEVTLTGPVERPVLTGGATATNSVLYFSDLITKDIVNLEDPMNADLVDTTALRAQNLRAQFQSRFLDSLQIRDLQFRVGEGVWLRSNEANLQLEGRVTVNKERWTPRSREYRVSGQLQTPRGTYTLKLGPVFRTFLVERGTLRYFNTPDLDATLDVEARHVVRTVQGTGASDEYPIIARITGTLLAPKLALTTAPDRAPLPERDLVSLLVTGALANSIVSQQADFRWDQAIGALGSTVLSAELQRSLIRDAGLPLDLVEIRPGFAQGSSLFASGGNVTTLAVGRQLLPRLFAILSAGACIGSGVDFSYQYLGASLEYRLHPTLRFQLAAEPAQSCLTQAARAFGVRSVYQFAADLRWDREY